MGVPKEGRVPEKGESLGMGLLLATPPARPLSSPKCQQVGWEHGATAIPEKIQQQRRPKHQHAQEKKKKKETQKFSLKIEML